MQTLECDTCGEEIEKYESQIKDHNFCSKDCYYEWESTVTGEDSPAWKGRQTTYTCEMCGEENTIPTAWYEKNPSRFCSRECMYSWRRVNGPDGTFRLDADGYQIVQISNETARISRLVAVAEHGMEALEDNHVHHLSGDSWLDFPANLSVVTPEEHRRIHAEEGPREPAW